MVGNASGGLNQAQRAKEASSRRSRQPPRSRRPRTTRESFCSRMWRKDPIGFTPLATVSSEQEYGQRSFNRPGTVMTVRAGQR